MSLELSQRIARMGTMSPEPFAHWPFVADRSEPAPSPSTVGWTEFEAAAPQLAGSARARLEASKHHVLATLRSDGAPRVSGTEVILDHGVVVIGAMWRSMKALDLLRDGRFALHSNPGDSSMEGGDAKLFGVAVPLSGTLATSIAGSLSAEQDSSQRAEIPEPYHLFRLDLAQVVLSEVDHERNCMVISSWWPERGLVVTERA